MPLVINYVKQEDKVIKMGKEPVADYYPPGATEPIVRPDNVPEPEKVEDEPEPEVETAPVVKKAEPKPVAKKK